MNISDMGHTHAVTKKKIKSRGDENVKCEYVHASVITKELVELAEVSVALLHTITGLVLILCFLSVAGSSACATTLAYAQSAHSNWSSIASSCCASTDRRGCWSDIAPCRETRGSSPNTSNIARRRLPKASITCCCTASTLRSERCGCP